ncbi:MAG: hypothetical protein RDV48_20270 [Candidatus Eremiobacteraeota bacterium]|nr:hypothetical protein [Candidatus Eremiobacteraeota bacterium]
MKLTKATEGHFNTHTKEFHKEEPKESCNFPYIEDEVILSWKEAKELGGDPCGHCFPDESKKNDTGKKKAK